MSTEKLNPDETELMAVKAIASACLAQNASGERHD